MKLFFSEYAGAVARKAAGVCVLSAGLASAQTNLVDAGSFEIEPVGQNTFTGWPLVNGSSDYSDYGVAHVTGGNEMADQGTNFAYFRGHPTDDSQDCLGTYVSPTVGGIYRISYWEATDGPLTNGAALWAQIGSDYGLSSADYALPGFFPNSPTALPYREFSTNWIATLSWATLSFHGINATNGITTTNGILLDNVSMVLVYPALKLVYTKPSLLSFTWPFTNSPYRLQSAATLTTNTWATLTNLPANVGSNNQILLGVSTNRVLFYRLTLP